MKTKKSLLCLLISLVLILSSVFTVFSSELYNDIDPPFSFIDLNDEAWYMPYITEMLDYELCGGISPSLFAPDMNMSRAMFVTVLSRLAGIDIDVYENAVSSFGDVNPDQWFFKAIMWAEEAEITNGISPTVFSPDSAVTREQMCVMIVRFSDYIKEELIRIEDEKLFDDESQISDFAKESVKICQTAGLIDGITPSTFAPLESATRAQTAKVISKFNAGIPGWSQKLEDRKKLKDEAEEYGFSYMKNGRSLVWHDEFDGESINYDKWNFALTMYTSNRVYDNSEKYCRIDNGQLHMQVHRSETPGTDFALSEGFTTMDTMNFKYGYLEMSARVPFRHGAWPSFWMKSNTPFATASWMSEVDIFEVFSSNYSLACNLHKWDYHSSNHVMLPSSPDYIFWDAFINGSEKLNSEFHVYGFGWDENEMTFYIDDVLYATIPIDPINGDFASDKLPGVQGFHDFHYIIFNNEIFTNESHWKPVGSALTDEDELPIDYYIEWIRLYQNPIKEEIKFKDEIIAAKENLNA